MLSDEISNKNAPLSYFILLTVSTASRHHTKSHDQFHDIILALAMQNNVSQHTRMRLDDTTRSDTQHMAACNEKQNCNYLHHNKEGRMDCGNELDLKRKFIIIMITYRFSDVKLNLVSESFIHV